LVGEHLDGAPARGDHGRLPYPARPKPPARPRAPNLAARDGLS
jgi:hypothetical protein